MCDCEPLELCDKFLLFFRRVDEHRSPERRGRLARHHAAEHDVPPHRLARDGLADDRAHCTRDDVLELQRTARDDGTDPMEAEAGCGDPPCNLALDRVKIEPLEVAGNRSPAARELAVGVEPGEKQREVALPDATAFGMELLERMREFVAELLHRPVRDQPTDPTVIACLPRQPLRIEETALLVFAATATRARFVPSSLRHFSERYEQ